MAAHNVTNTTLNTCLSKNNLKRDFKLGGACTLNLGRYFNILIKPIRLISTIINMEKRQFVYFETSRPNGTP